MSAPIHLHDLVAFDGGEDLVLSAYLNLAPDRQIRRTYREHEQGGWSQANYQRHHEAHLYWHVKRVAAELSVLLRRRPFDRLVVAGPEEATSELQRLLPRALRTRLVATFQAELFASEREILERTLEIERDVEREVEEGLVRELFESACGATPAPQSDIVERAIERTLEEAGAVEVVHGEPASRLRAEGGGLGALLRF